MSDALSAQIGAFRAFFERYRESGVTLSPEAVDTFDAMFNAFQVQAKMLEGKGAPDLANFQTICRAASAEAKAISGMAKNLEATTARLRSAEIVAFKPRGDAR